MGQVLQRIQRANHVTRGRLDDDVWSSDVIAAILKVWRHIRNLTPSIDAYSFEEYSCWICTRLETTEP